MLTYRSPGDVDMDGPFIGLKGDSPLASIDKGGLEMVSTYSQGGWQCYFVGCVNIDVKQF